VVRLRRQRAVQRDDVGFRCQGSRIGVGDAERFQRSIAPQIIGQDATSKAGRKRARHQRADLPGTDHASGAAMQVEAEQPL
jgi:hypothetical protein